MSQHLPVTIMTSCWGINLKDSWDWSLCLYCQIALLHIMNKQTKQQLEKFSIIYSDKFSLYKFVLFISIVYKTSIYSKPTYDLQSYWSCQRYIIHTKRVVSNFSSMLCFRRRMKFSYLQADIARYMLTDRNEREPSLVLGQRSGSIKKEKGTGGEEKF